MSDQVHPLDGPRKRRKSNIWKPEFVEKKVFAIEKGTGTALGDIPYLMNKMRKIKPGDRILLLELHRLFFARAGKARTQVKNVLQFSGFPQDGLDAIVARREAKIDKFSTALLKRLMDLLEIDRSAKSFESGKANKAELGSRFLEWITAPKPNPPKKAKAEKKATPAKKKTISKSKTIAKAKRKKRATEKDTKKHSQDCDEAGTNKQQQEAKVTAKKTSGTPKVKRPASRRKRWFVASENMLSGKISEPAPKARKRKRPKKKTAKPKKLVSESESEELSPELKEIKDTVYAILAVVDKKTVTMKMVRMQAEKQLDKQLVQHKAAIKTMVQQFFAN